MNNICDWDAMIQIDRKLIELFKAHLDEEVVGQIRSATHGTPR